MDTASAARSVEDDRKAVAALDTEYQAAVERNDAATIERIHHPDMILVLSNGTVIQAISLSGSASIRLCGVEPQKATKRCGGSFFTLPR